MSKNWSKRKRNKHGDSCAWHINYAGAEFAVSVCFLFGCLSTEIIFKCDWDVSWILSMRWLKWQWTKWLATKAVRLFDAKKAAVSTPNGAQLTIKREKVMHKLFIRARTIRDLGESGKSSIKGNEECVFHVNIFPWCHQQWFCNKFMAAVLKCRISTRARNSKRADYDTAQIARNWNANKVSFRSNWLQHPAL